MNDGQIIEAQPTNLDSRRSGSDRRRHSISTLTYCGLQRRGRRKLARRSGHSYYLDRYKPTLVLTGLTILLLSSMDALFTLTLLQHGAYEANAFMAHLLNHSNALFVATKISITAAGVLFLMAHSQFRFLRISNGEQALQWLLVPYGILIIYELTMLKVLL